MNRTGGYVSHPTDTVERGCPHCEWFAVEHSYGAMVAAYQDHLRTDHPRAWLRS